MIFVSNPNPATGSITIEVTSAKIHEVIEHVEMPNDSKGNEGKNSEHLNNRTTNNELRITDQYGKIVKTVQIKEPNSKTVISTKGWSKGTYLCSLMIGKKTVKTEKLVIE